MLPKKCFAKVPSFCPDLHKQKFLKLRPSARAVLLFEVKHLSFFFTLQTFALFAQRWLWSLKTSFAASLLVPEASHSTSQCDVYSKNVISFHEKKCSKLENSNGSEFYAQNWPSLTWWTFVETTCTLSYTPILVIDFHTDMDIWTAGIGWFQAP